MVLGPQYEHHVGTPNFMAPEAINGVANDRRSDLWSLGCTIAQMLVGTPPFGAATPFLVMTKAQAGSPPWLPERGLAKEAKDLVRCLVQTVPEKRLGGEGSTEKVLDHPFLQGAAASSAGSIPRPLDAALKLIARAGMNEVAAVLAAEELAAAEASWGDLPQAAGVEVTAPSLEGGDQPGKATAGLLAALPKALEDAGRPGERLLAAVQRAASEAETTAEPALLTSRVATALAEEAVVADSGNLGGEEAALLQEALELVHRFAELAKQSLLENKEVPNFGGDDEDSGTEPEQDEKDEKDEKDREQPESRTEVTAQSGTSVVPEEIAAAATAQGTSGGKQEDADLQQKHCCMLL